MNLDGEPDRPISKYGRHLPLNMETEVLDAITAKVLYVPKQRRLPPEYPNLPTNKPFDR